MLGVGSHHARHLSSTRLIRLGNLQLALRIAVCESELHSPTAVILHTRCPSEPTRAESGHRSITSVLSWALEQVKPPQVLY